MHFLGYKSVDTVGWLIEHIVYSVVVADFAAAVVVNAVVDFTVLSCNPDDSLGSDTDISNLAEGVGFNLDPFLGVEFVKVSVSGDSPRVAISTSTDSNSLDVVSEFT